MNNIIKILIFKQQKYFLCLTSQQYCGVQWGQVLLRTGMRKRGREIFHPSKEHFSVSAAALEKQGTTFYYIWNILRCWRKKNLVIWFIILFYLLFLVFYMKYSGVFPSFTIRLTLRKRGSLCLTWSEILWEWVMKIEVDFNAVYS